MTLLSAFVTVSVTGSICGTVCWCAWLLHIHNWKE